LEISNETQRIWRDIGEVQSKPTERYALVGKVY